MTRSNHCSIMSGHGTIETAVKATKLGAWDFVEKPLSIDRIIILLNNIFSFQDERGDKNALLTKLRKNIAMLGDSPNMVVLKQMCSFQIHLHQTVMVIMISCMRADIN